MERYIVGSKAFFNGMQGYKGKDFDYLIFTNNPRGFKWRKETHACGICIFEYKKDTAKNMIDKTLEVGDALLIGKFLVPEVAKALNLTIEDIKPLQVLLHKLDSKHKYEEVIFNAYMENGGFVLTERQRENAFKIYLDTRKCDTNKKD